MLDLSLSKAKQVIHQLFSEKAQNLRNYETNSSSRGLIRNEH